MKQVALLLAAMIGGAAVQAATFGEINDRVLTPACAGCHTGEDASAGIDLTSLENVRANLEGIKLSVESGTMPMFGELLDEDKELLLKWISEGGPE